MRYITTSIVVVLLSSVACVAHVHAQSVSFREQVAPILVRRCLTCHGEQKFKGEYQLHTFESLMKAGESGDPSVAPGKPEDSNLLQLISEGEMPKDADPLSKDEIERIKNWIAAGAKFDGDDPKADLVSTVVWTHPDPPESYPRPFPITALAFRPDGKELAVGGFHEITIWNAEDGTLARRITNIAERTYALQYNKDGSQLAAASGTPAQLGEVKLFDPADGTLIRHFGSMTDCAFDVAYSADGQRLAACGADHQVRVFDVATGKQELVIKDHSDWVMGVAFSPDGGKLASASCDKTCKVFDAKTGELTLTYPDHAEPVYDIAFSDDGSRVISCGGDNRIRVWHSTDQGYEDKEMKKKKREHIADISGFGGAVFAMVVAQGQVFACSEDTTARQFDAEKRNQIRQFSGHEEWLYAIALNQQVHRLATAGLDGEVRIWDIEAKDQNQMQVLAFTAAPGYQAANTAKVAGGK